MTHKETLSFKTEEKQILNLVINSLYSESDIFLRELISNASDALDKLRFLAISEPTLYENDSDLNIKVLIGKNTITLIDNGIGMSREEVIDNLGTIAKSGTKDFLSRLSEAAKDSHLIGQFGVGFYSAFIVAERVVVKSRRAGLSPENGVVWESNGEGSFTIEDAPRAERGTEITLFLKEGQTEYANDWRLRSIIRKYSDHICWPILMEKSDDKLNDKEEVESSEALKQESPALEVVNKATALWTKRSGVTDEEYKGLYQHITHDFEPPLKWLHNRVEGTTEYTSLLYIPSHAPFNLQEESGLNLYVNQVFILNKADTFLPRYLRFMKGIVDAKDLPLNVSRELLQNNKQVDVIKGGLTKRVLGFLKKMSQDEPETYQKFWDAFSLIFKEGPVEDFANKEAIAELLRFASTANDSSKQTVSLDAYIERMKPQQEKIYYITASSYNAAKNSPHLEIFKQKGIEVLLLSDRIDEWLTGYLSEFKGKKLQSISKGKVDVTSDEDVKTEDTAAEEKTLESMLAEMKKILEGKVEDVVFTTRLTESPTCVVAPEGGMSRELERILQSTGQSVPASKPIFEINPKHALIKRLHGMEDEEQFAQWVNMLFEQALLAESGQLDNPAEFVSRVNKLLLSA